MSENYLITIGIGRYKYQKEGDQLGMSCENDCRDLREALRDYEFKSLTYKFYSENDNAAAADWQEKEAHLYNEEATRANIDRLFMNLGKHPDFSSDQAGQHLHNLIIYYSGHGIISERFNVKKYFSWVPHGYPRSIDDKPDVFELYELETQLLKSLGVIRFKNLILITDSCYSGLGLTINNLVPQTKEMPGFGGPEQRSVWTICSCAANRRAFANDRNSQFTAQLVNFLNNQDDNEFRTSALIDYMTGLDIPGQQPFGQKLDIIADNLGNYTFSCTPDRQERNALKSVIASLQDGLPRYLNYTNEKAVLKQLDKTVDSIVIFSNSKDSGLPLMIRSALTEEEFPFENPPRIISEKVINNEPTLLEKLSSFFYHTVRLEGPIDSEDDLVQGVANKLRSKDRFIGLLLNEDARENNNFEFVEKLHDILDKTHNFRPTPYRIYLFILDEFKTDYSQLLLKKYDKVKSLLITDKISIKNAELDAWHREHRRSVTSQVPKHDFIKCYLRDSIYNLIRVNFVEESPEFVIQQICEKAKCPPLATMLLTTIDGKI